MANQCSRTPMLHELDAVGQAKVRAAQVRTGGARVAVHPSARRQFKAAQRCMAAMGPQASVCAVAVQAGAAV